MPEVSSRRHAPEQKSAEASLRKQIEFFATVAHELRTPLTLILGPLESLLAGESGPLSESQKSSLHTIHNSSIRLLQMVSGLLDFSKLEAGKIEVNHEPVQIVALTGAILADFQPVMQQKRLESKFEFTSPELTVRIDRYLYERILFNLLSNAVKFTPPAGKIFVFLKLEGNRLTLSVNDTGIGMSDADMEVLFQKFQQLPRSSTRRFEGTGLGLFLAKEFAGLLGGTVWVESSPGVGSTFTLECEAPPCDGAPAAVGSAQRGLRIKAGSDTAPTSPQLQAEEHLPKVLIVEDNLEFASYVAAVLRGYGQCRISTDGEEAFQTTRQWNPDLVLSAVMLPKLDGLMLCRQIKSDPLTSQIPVVLLTGLTDREALLKGWEAGADEYLFKPFHPKELVTRVKSILLVWQQRMRAAEELRRAHEQLEIRVQERTAELEKALQEKEVLLKEVHHRVKNNLQVIASLLNLQLRGIKDPQAHEMFRESQNRIETMALIHEALYQSQDLGKIHFAEYIRNLLADLVRSYAGAEAAITLKTDLDPVLLGIDTAIPCALIISELVSNAFKHAFPERQQGVIEIQFHSYDHDKFKLSVRDNGVGFPKDLHLPHDQSLGLHLVTSLADQLGGALELRGENGTSVTVTFRQEGQK